MQLPQADPVDAELPPAADRLLAQILGTAVGNPDIGTAARQPALRRNQVDASIRVQRFVDELLGDVGAVGIGGVDEIDPEPGKPLQGPGGLGPVHRWAPDTRTGDAHGSETESIDLDITADLERTGLACV